MGSQTMYLDREELDLPAALRIIKGKNLASVSIDVGITLQTQNPDHGVCPETLF